MSDAYPNFFADFFDDYVAESEEHLATVKQNLLALENSVNQKQIDSSILNQLFRSFHSLKGLSGMVGVKEAEEIAHHMESYLKVLRDGQITFSNRGFESLLDGTKLLERVIAAQQAQTKIPDIVPVVEALKKLIPSPNSSPSKPLPTGEQKTGDQVEPPIVLKLKEEEKEHLDNALKQGFRLWQLVFVPNTALAKRGINVNYIRERLQSHGQLIHSAPRMTSGGGIAFDFLLGLNEEPPVVFPEAPQEGLSWTPYVFDFPLSSQKTQSQDITEPPTPPEKVISSPPVTSEKMPEKLSETTELSPSIKTKDPPPETPPPVIPSSSEKNPLENATPALLTQPSNVVRVDLPKLDELMRMVGDLVISRARLEDTIIRLKEELAPAQMRSLEELNLTLERQLRDLREGVMRVRLVPIGEIFARMKFVVRDLVRETQKKQIVLDLKGHETEIDKFVVERMMDPLLHLVRNAVSHGIEPESERVKKGKSPEGKITLKASTSGEMVIIEIIDDGQGIAQEKVLKKARSLGIWEDQEDSLNHPDPRIILDILCTPGFSTKDEVDLTSGRGVGMAIVKNTVQELGGVLTFETQPDQGTHFTIQLPLTLAIADALIITVNEETFAIPQTSVREVIEIEAKDITTLENNQITHYRRGILPLIFLRELFKFNIQEHYSGGFNRDSPGFSQNHLLRVVIVGSGLKAIGLVVDRILGQREIVVRNLTDPLVQVTGISGATELGDGRVVLILDAVSLEREASKIKLKNP